MCFHRKFFLVISLCTLLLAGEDLYSHEDPDIVFSSSTFGDLGKVTFPISCEANVQPKMNRALALLHHMMYAQAQQRFMELARQYPNCAMLYWGQAMSLFHPLWPVRPSEDKLIMGAAALSKAQTLKPMTERERAYIGAAKAFYESWQDKSYSDRIVTWEQAQKSLYEAYPEDVDAAAFYALSHLATAAKDDKSFSHQKKAGQLLEQLYEKAPAHPGVIHYTIHAYDNPLLAKHAVKAARAYDKIAPDVPHALHMPTHIFVRLGMWRDANNWNRRSGRSALKYPAGEYISHHYLHALDYLAYGYLQIAESDQVKEIMTEVREREAYQPSFVSGYALAAMPARQFLELRQWGQASSLSVQTPQSFPWKKFPELEAITYYAKGIGSARQKNIAAAEAALQKLDELHQLTVESGKSYWAVLVNAQRKSVAAWLLLAKGDDQQALVTMASAADLEDSVDKHPVTPGAVLPARELLGDMLVLTKNYQGAMGAYLKALSISPNRFNSLYGVAKAAQMAGDEQMAISYYQTLLALTDNKRADRKELFEARKFVGGE
jgi:tetratricopeptide (TPR) repeat protein